MKIVGRVVKNNVDSIFVALIIFATNLGLFLNVLGKENLTSLIFKMSFVTLSLWLILKCFVMRKRSFAYKDYFKNPYFVSLFLIILFAIFLSFIVAIPAFNEATLSFDYLIKFIQCIFAFIALLLFCNASVNKHVIRTIVIVSVGFSLFLLIGFFIPSIRNKAYTGAVTFNLGNPNTTASVLMYNAFILFYGVFVFRSRVFRLFLGLLSAATFVLIYFTQSRNPYVAILFAIVFSIIWRLTRRFNSRRTIAPIALVTSVLLFASIYFLYYYIESNGAPAQSIIESSFGKGFSTRYAVWTDAFKKIGEHFWLGNYYYLKGTFQYHNSILDLFVAYGFLGGVLCCSILIYILFNFIFTSTRIVGSQKISIFCFIAFMYTGLFEASFFNSAQGICVLFFVFLSFAKTPLTNDCVSENNALFFNKRTFKKCDVLIINSVFQKGSTGKIVNTLFNYSSKQYKTICLYGRKRATPKMNVAKCCTEFQSKTNHLINLITKDPYLFNLSSTFEIIRVIKKYKPKVVHLHNLNDYYVNQYLLLKFLNRNMINTIVTLHSENFYVGCQEGHVFECEGWANGLRCQNCKQLSNKRLVARKWKRMNKALIGFNNLRFVAVSPWLAERARRSSLLQGHKVDAILNGIDEIYFEHTIDRYKDIKNKNVLFVCADTKNPIKGYNYFLELAEMYKEDKDVIFTLLSLEKNSYKNLPQNIIVHEPLSNLKDLRTLYESASATLVLSKRETFSMPVAESLSCGTQVVGFVCGGAESIGLAKYSSFVEYGKVDALKTALDKTLTNQVDSLEIIQEAREKYSASTMWLNYNRLYYPSLFKKEFMEIEI